MSKIEAKYNIDEKNWTVENVNIEPLQTFLAIKFETDKELDNFKFGYEIFEDEELKQVEGFPPLGIRFKKSDLMYLDEYPTMLKYNSKYKIMFWAEDSGERHYHMHEFVCPLPKPPYPSWIWDGEKHVAPKPDPSDPADINKTYVWNEENQEWELDKEGIMRIVLGVEEGPIE